MANKRNLKKAIKAACGDLAGECLIARDLVPGIDRKKMTDIFFDIADLQYVSIDNVSFSFDKTEKSFAKNITRQPTRNLTTTSRRA